MTNVLVTGGSGFIAGHCILQLLATGHQVRATLRSLNRADSVRTVLQEAGMVNGDQLSFVVADLMNDSGWPEAMQDIDYVLHVASPVQPGHVENEDDVIVPAREGTLRVLRAAHNAGVKRTVLTSAFHAVSWGYPHDPHVFTEADWTILDGPGVDAYAKAKTLAERDAWEFMKTSGTSMELVTLLPVAVMGPVLGKEISGSNHLIQTIMQRGMPAYPNLYIPIVDVRDVAQAHLRAMITPEAVGGRFLLSNGPAVALKEIGGIIKANLGAAANRVPTRTLPDIVVRIAARFSPQLRAFAPDLGYIKQTSDEKARRVLAWFPRSVEEAVVSAAQSLVHKGLVSKTSEP